MTPRKAKQLQKDALVLLDSKKRTEKEFARASLLHTCSKAVALAMQLEVLQPTASIRAVNLLEQLAAALQRRTHCDTFYVDELYNEKADKRAEKLSIKALCNWYDYVKELPESLAFDLERIERRRNITKLPAGFTSGRQQKVVASKTAAAKKSTVKKLPAKKAAPAKKVAVKQ